MKAEPEGRRSSFRAYEQFVALMNQGKHRRAFKLFSKTPSIVNEMRINEFSNYFQTIWSTLGGDEAALFDIAMRAAFEDLHRKALISGPKHSGHCDPID
jgi:hypothetical protein